MMRLWDLKEVAGETGSIKLAWTYREKWSLMVTTSDGKAWVGKHPELEALCLRCMDALNPEDEEDEN